ncbi:MAG: hypothetical protein IJ733_18610 [Lachnospiraceae bacterium]|nr:hypothetical protein [Lachnospiraceae bacterium]
MKSKKTLSMLLAVSLLFLSSENFTPAKRADADSVSHKRAESSGEQAPSPSQTAELETPTPSPSQTPAPTQTPSAVPTKTPKPSKTPKPTATPKPVLLKSVTGVKSQRYSTTAAKLTWKKAKKAKYYRIYVSKKKNSGYQVKGTTKKIHFLVKKLKNNTKYYFYVQSCRQKKASASDSRPSKKVHIRTNTYSRKTIFAGDSITQGITYYLHNKIPIGGTVKTVAAVSLNTRSFASRRVFNGMTGIQKTIAEKPYRVYFMLGINNINYMPPSSLISDYTRLIQKVKKESPHTDIVLCGLAPATKYRSNKEPGYKQIPAFNKKLKALAKKFGVHYFYYADFMKDSDGYLKSSYASRDGYHWQVPVYHTFAEKVRAYEKTLDQ